MFLYILSQTMKLAIGIGCNHFSSVNCKKNAETYLEHPYNPVYDIIHIHTQPISLHSPDYLLILASCAALFKCYLIYHVQLLRFLENEINILSCCLLLRSITTQLTIVPTCMPLPNKKTPSKYSTLFVSTHDLMYSGHTILFIFFGKILEYNSSYTWLYMYPAKIIQYIFPISCILSRQHYTIDVVISMIVYNYVTFLLN